MAASAELIAVPRYQHWVILECGHHLAPGPMNDLTLPAQPCFECGMRRYGPTGLLFRRCVIWMEGGPWT